MTDYNDIPSQKKAFNAIVLTLVVAGAVTGAVAAGIFASYQFTRQGGCGMVRFYEHAFGAIVIGGWLAGTAVGIGLSVYGFRKRAFSVIPGTAVTWIAAVLMTVICVNTVRTIREADYTIKDVDLLLDFVSTGTLEKKIQAAHELGNRKEGRAVPLMCEILENPAGDINLRLTAARALGMICSDPCPAETDMERVITVLQLLLRSEDKFLPDAAVEALERIGTPEALEALERFRNPSIDASEGFIGEWELREGENRLTVTFSADEETVLDRWDAEAVKNYHLDSSWGKNGDKIIVNDLNSREWIFHFRQGRLFFVENGVEKEMLRISRKTNKEG